MDKVLRYEVSIHESNFYNVSENIILSYVPLAVSSETSPICYIYFFSFLFVRGQPLSSWLKESPQCGSEVHELTKRLKQTKLSWVWCVKMYRIWTKRIRQPCCIITNSSCLFFKSLWLYKQSSWKNKRLRMYINVWNPKQILSRRCRQNEIVKNKR